MENKNQKHTFYVKGMHCASCEILVDSELKDLPNIISAKSDLNTSSVEVVGDFGNKTKEKIAEELTVPLKSHGYTVFVERQIDSSNLKDFKVAIPIALIFVFLFILLQKLGIVNLINAKNLNYGTIFLIGIIASLSSCMAVVGGLLLSMSVTFAKSDNRLQPQFLFHGGRIISFFIFGGVIGAVGSAFTLSSTASFILSLIIGIVMLILGINLLDVFNFTRKIQPVMPKFISERAYGISKLNHTVTPLLVGIATFFLPCGFTQSMQLYALSTGGFMKGSLTMLVFAIGTLPVLALVSFGSLSIKNSSMSGIFFKTAGFIVIAFALFNIINSLVVVGIISPIFNF